MKKLAKILLSLTCLFFLCGCEIYVYNSPADTTTPDNNDDGNKETDDNQNDESSITQKPNYSGFVNTVDTIPDQNKPWNEIYDNVKSSVVTIRNIQDNEIDSTGSGVFFSEDATDSGYLYIFTNAHVVKDANKIEVLLHDGMLIKGENVGYDTNEDVAVVRIKKSNAYNYTLATLRNSNTLAIGEEVLAIGSPLGEKYANTATSGIISNLNISQSEQDSSVNLYLIQINAALNPGNSGGPLFDKGGNLIGINTLKLTSSGTTSDVESFNYSIPISHFYNVAKKLLKGEKYKRPFLNITIIDVIYLTFAERDQYSITLNHGLRLININPASPLYLKATEGQIITHIEGIKITKDSDFSIKLLEYYPGDTITLTISNPDGSQPTNVDVTLIER